jgi:hypothetical protein
MQIWQELRKTKELPGESLIYLPCGGFFIHSFRVDSRTDNPDAPDKSRGAGFQPAENPEKTAGYKPAPRENWTLVGRVNPVRRPLRRTGLSVLPENQDLTNH